jgi:DNA-binding SARP family transcriptional activator
VAYVALHRGPATRSHVAGMLWLDAPESRAMASLRSALWRLRRPGLQIIQARGEQLSLVPGIQVDVLELSTVARGWRDGVTAHSHLDPLDRLAMSGDLLSDWYDDWVLVERERFRQLRLQVLERLAMDLAAEGQFGRAVETALAAVSSEPLRESAHRALISIHLDQGNRVEAIRQYCIYANLLREELNLEPSGQMRELIGPLPAWVVGRMTRQGLASRA